MIKRNSGVYNVTGTRHGIIKYFDSERDARYYFHHNYKGESIVFVRCDKKILQPIHWCALFETGCISLIKATTL